MPGCSAAGCEGGFVKVGEPWVAKQIERLPEGLPADRRASRIAALRDTWYPCRECQPRQFHRWAGGHWASDHDVQGCEECRAALASSVRRHREPRRMEVERVPPRPAIDPGDDAEGLNNF